jgi:hypothetical protein
VISGTELWLPSPERLACMQTRDNNMTFTSSPVEDWQT